MDAGCLLIDSNLSIVLVEDVQWGIATSVFSGMSFNRKNANK